MLADSTLAALRRLLEAARRARALYCAAVAVAVLCGAVAANAAPAGAVPARASGRPVAKPRVAPASAVTAPVRTVRTADGTVSYRSVGHGRPLVLIMGLGGSIDVWPPDFVDALARHHRVIAFDNEGVGLSTLRPGTLTISGMADDTAAFISALHLRRPDVLGWSMGGFIAQSFAARHPGQYRRLILSATAPGDGHAVAPSAAAIKALTGGVGGALSFLFPPDQSAEIPAFTAAIVRYPHFYAASPTITNLQLTASGQWLAGDDPSGHHDRQIHAPTLIGDGVEDALIPSANSTKLAQLIRGARLKLYPDAGHGFIFQDESSWAALINHFLAARDKRSR